MICRYLLDSHGTFSKTYDSFFLSSYSRIVEHINEAIQKLNRHVLQNVRLGHPLVLSKFAAKRSVANRAKN